MCGALKTALLKRKRLSLKMVLFLIKMGPPLQHDYRRLLKMVLFSRTSPLNFQPDFRREVQFARAGAVSYARKTCKRRQVKVLVHKSWFILFCIRHWAGTSMRAGRQKFLNCTSSRGRASRCFYKKQRQEMVRTVLKSDLRETFVDPKRCFRGSI